MQGIAGLVHRSGITLNRTSARASFATAVRTMPPTWPAPTVSGPRWPKSHCDPIRARPKGLRTWSLSDPLLAQPHDDARLVVVLQVGADLGRIDLHADAV